MMRRILAPAKPLLVLCARIETALARRWVAAAYRRLLKVQWALPPEPESFEHHIDLYYQWLATRDAMWLERGVFSRFAIRGGPVLELACGDGFNARNFYSARCSQVIACDIDAEAIRFARAHNPAPNLEYRVLDIRTGLPEGHFENVIWDAAIEHFTEAETGMILRRIKSCLDPEGVLSGYTMIERRDGRKQLSHHEHEFASREELGKLLARTFANVLVIETPSLERHNLYFLASDGALPFSANWPTVFRAGTG